MQSIITGIKLVTVVFPPETCSKTTTPTTNITYDVTSVVVMTTAYTTASNNDGDFSSDAYSYLPVRDDRRNKDRIVRVDSIANTTVPRDVHATDG